VIQHAYRYISMGEKVIDSLEEGSPEAEALRAGIEALEDAETALVRAYGVWRDAITAAAHAGNYEAAKVLERTAWDLT
jgi:hypothetical protein